MPYFKNNFTVLMVNYPFRFCFCVIRFFLTFLIDSILNVNSFHGFYSFNEIPLEANYFIL